MLAGLLFSLLVAQTPPPSVSESATRDLVARATSRSEEGEVVSPLELLQQALAMDEAAGRREDVARDLAVLGHRLSALGRTDEAIAHLRRAVEIWRSLGLPEQTVTTLQQLGIVLFSHSRFEEGRQRLDEALVLARQVGLFEAGLQSDLGMILQAMGRSIEAMDHHLLALEGHERVSDSVNAANTLGNIANLHLTAGRFPEAAAAYARAQAAFEKAGDSARTTTTAVNLGMVHLAEGKYDEARLAIEVGLERARRGGWTPIQAAAQLHLANAYEATGLFDRAEAAYTESLALFQSADNPQNAAAALRGLASLQLAWGHTERALTVAGDALALAQRLNIQDQVLSNLEILGAAHRARGRFNTAILHYRRALGLATRLGRDGDVSRLENDLGAAFLCWGKPAEAEKHFGEALTVAERLGQRHTIAQAHIHIGAAREAQGDAAGAREAYLRGLALSRAAGTKADEAIALDNLGALALHLGERRDAERHLLGAIAIREQLRKTTKKEDRSSFLAAWISSYRWLVQLHFMDGNASAAFDASERIKARHLAERISERAQPPPAAPVDIETFRRGLGPSEAIVSFANVDWRHPIGMVVTRDGVKAYALDVEGLGRRVRSSPTVVDQPEASLRPGTMPRTPVLGTVVQEYRRLLGLVSPSSAERRRRDRFARELFDTLLGPADGVLARVGDVVVIPEGSLSLVPMETLRLPDGRYLVSRHNVTYVPSLRVMQLLRQRQHPARARSLLALGGAPHRGTGERRAAAVSPLQIQALRAAARRRLESGRGVAEVYAALGHGQWADLPAARAEVEAIGRIVPQSTVLTGLEASEKGLKSLSRAGTLREFKTLHFATHGFTVDEAPELSALVLSEAGQSVDQEEDGYLNLDEIATLDIRPDLVTLSSCESGLGTIYGGEGTVGLTQAFLEAGANGVSVSLWQVHDTSARDFMVGLYRNAQDQGLTYARAMTAAKRSLLRQGKTEPALWAAFVYYGI